VCRAFHNVAIKKELYYQTPLQIKNLWLTQALKRCFHYLSILEAPQKEEPYEENAYLSVSLKDSQT
jgi:hypothetical protein